MSAITPVLGTLSSSQLSAAGLGRREREAALSRGDLRKLRRPWYAQRDAHPDAIAAVNMGGALTATSASRHHGMWTVDDDKLHIVIRRHGSRRLVEGSDRQVCVHWMAEGEPPATVVAGPLQIVRDAAHRRPTEVALADSGLALHRFTLEELDRVAHDVARACDPASQSGTETICRMRLRRHGIKVRSQFKIAGVGRVDLLVGDRLVIECDSESFHDGYRSERDYDRDLTLIDQGYLVLRLRYRHVMFEWDRVIATILAIVRSDRHLWRRGMRGTVLAL